MIRSSEQEFLARLSEQGIVPDARFPERVSLKFASGSSEFRFWEVPPASERRPYFLNSILDGLGEWSTCAVWQHSGSWQAERRIDPARINDVVAFQMMRALGVPMGSADIVTFSSAERPTMLSLLFIISVFGWCVDDDLYVIPEHARFIVEMDHHGVVHVTFRNVDDVAPFVSQMEHQGFELPGGPPDPTFKPQPWFKSG